MNISEGLIPYLFSLFSFESHENQSYLIFFFVAVIAFFYTVVLQKPDKPRGPALAQLTGRREGEGNIILYGFFFFS